MNPTTPSPPRYLIVILILFVVALAACTSTPEDSTPVLTPAARASRQNECGKIADRSERQTCLDRAAFGERW